MEKLKITREQEKAIEWYRENFTNEGAIQDFIRDRHPALSEFTTEQFALLFLEWYEVEPEFKVGDWVIFTDEPEDEPIFGRINKNMIVEWDDDVTNNYDEIQKLYKEGHLRHATPEEIAEEKERRWWAKHGRDVWELREHDILVFEGDSYNVDFIKEGTGRVIFKDALSREFEEVKQRFRVACFAEDRKDVKNND